jgi:PAS domain S-box-containing protein
MLDRQQIERIGLEEALRRMPAAAIVAEAPSGKIILINERARRMLERNAGWSGLPEPEGIEDFGDLKMFRPDGRPVEMEEWPLVRSIRSGEEVRDEEQSYLLADGSRITIRSDSSPIHDDEGRIVAGVLIVRDVTERKRSEEDMRASEERFRATFEQSAVGMSHTAPDGTLLRINRRLCEMLGYTQEDLLGTKIQSRTHPDDLEKDLDQTRRLIAGEIETYSMEKRLLRKDDSVLWINLTVSLARDASGEPDYLIAVCEDVDKRKRDQQALAEADRREREILESITDALYVLDSGWRFTYLNERALRHLQRLKGDEGLTRENLLGKNIWEEFPAAVGSEGYRKFHEAMHENKTVGYEEPYPPDGPWFEVRAYSSEEGLSVYFRDVTEDRLDREQSARYAHLEENTNDAFIATDDDLVVRAWNRGAERMYGLTAAEAVGLDAREATSLEMSDEQAAASMREIAEKGQLRVEQLQHRKDGTPIYVDSLTIAMRDESGETTGYLAVNRDVTERWREQEDQKRLTDIVQTSSEFIGVADLDGRATFLNEAGQRMVGLNGMEEVRRKRISDFFMPEDRDFLMGEIMPALEERGRWAGELRFRHFQTGEPIPVLCDGFRIDDPRTGEPIGLATVTHDISERKRAEREAREASRRIEDILESVTDAFYALDHEWRLTYLNERALRFASQLAGEEFTLDDLIGRTLWETLPAIVGTSIEDEYRRAVREQRTAVFEYPYPGGGPIFEVHAYPSEQGLSIYFQDVTERKRTEETVRERSRQQAIVADLGLRALANHDVGSLLDDTVALVARALYVECCRVVEILPGGEELLLRAGFGWQEGAVGSTAEIDPQVAYTLSSSGPVMFEDLEAETRFEPSPMLRAHGVVSGMTVLIPGREEPYGALGAHTVTRRTFSEEDANFLQAVANVLATVIEREKTETELGEVREAERSRIARDLHDKALQDLAYAMTQAQTVRAAPAGGGTADRTDGLTAALKRVEQQLRGAIYDLRLEAEHDKPFSELLLSLIELHRTMAPDLDFRVDLRDVDLEGPLKKVGRETLRIVGEALTNARRHSGARNIGVLVSTSGGRLLAEVSDDGRGTDPSREPSPDGGMGIKGMRERARALGGELKIQSEPAMGTKVIFEMALEPGRKRPEGDVRVLLVEDHAAVREAVAASFEREAGFEVVGQAGSLGAARRLLAEGIPVDVAVVDLGLPDGHGGDLIEDLRAANPEAQALVLSVSLDRAETARAVQSGAASVLQKTAHLDEVVEAVERLRAGETLMPLEEVVELLRFAGTKKDEEYEARQAIESLTPREIEVLQKLAGGLDSDGIAESLHISVRTQRNHVASILAKLGVHSQLQAVVFAVRHGAVKIS